MNEIKKQNSLSDKIAKIDNNYIKYSTINHSNNKIQEILNKYSNYSQKIKHFQIYNPEILNTTTNYNFSAIRLNTVPNRSNNINKYINDSFKNNHLKNDYNNRTKYNINSMEEFFDKYSKKIEYLKNIIKVNNNDENKHKYLDKGNLFSLINNKNIQNFPSSNFSNYNNKTNNNSIYNQIYSKKKNNPVVKINKTNIFHISNFNDYSFNSSLNDKNTNNHNFQNNYSFPINKSNIYKNVNFPNDKSEITLSYFDFTTTLEELINEKRNLFVFMFGSKDNNNLSWCRDCNIADPFVSNGKKIVKNNNSILWVNIPIDKNKKYAYKYNKFLKLNYVPTLIYFKNGIEIGRIIQNDLFNQENINYFIIQSLNK